MSNSQDPLMPQKTPSPNPKFESPSPPQVGVMDGQLHLTTPLQFAARNYLLSLLSHSVITLSFGPQHALQRVLRFIHPVYDGNVPLETFFSSSTVHIGHHFGVLHSSIAFFAYDALNIHASDKQLLVTGQPGWTAPYCIIDIIVDNPTLVIPSHLFIPHDGSRRMESFLQRTDMLPIFFPRMDGGLGVRIDSNADFDMLLDVPTRITAHSLKVILHLVNYSMNEKQIQLRSAAAGPNVSSRRLARLVASKVSYFIKEASKENTVITHWANPRWRMGSGPGCITINDVVLLGIVFVSQGKVTPLLRVRSDFGLPWPIITLIR